MAACASSRARVDEGATLKLVRLERVLEPRAAKLVGHFVVQNASGRDLCIKRDILENELSPHAIVWTKTGQGAFKGSLGTPYPPKTTAATTLSPGTSASFRRVVHYVAPSDDTASLRLKVEAVAWRCEDGRAVKLQSDAFNPTPFETAR